MRVYGQYSVPVIITSVLTDWVAKFFLIIGYFKSQPEYSLFSVVSLEMSFILS